MKMYLLRIFPDGAMSTYGPFDNSQKGHGWDALVAMERKVRIYGLDGSSFVLNTPATGRGPVHIETIKFEVEQEHGMRHPSGTRSAEA